jgi:hypothetical protein
MLTTFERGRFHDSAQAVEEAFNKLMYLSVSISSAMLRGKVVEHLVDVLVEVMSILVCAL